MGQLCSSQNDSSDVEPENRSEDDGAKREKRESLPLSELNTDNVTTNREKRDDEIMESNIEDKEMIEETKNKLYFAKALYVTGVGLFNLHQYDDAIQRCMESLQKAKEIGNSELALKSCVKLSEAYFFVKQYIESYKFGLEALEFDEVKFDQEQEMYACAAVGHSLKILAEEQNDGDEEVKFKKSADYFQRAAAIAQTVEKKQAEMTMYNNLAQVYIRLNRHNEVKHFATKALEMAQLLGDTAIEMASLEAIIIADKLTHSDDILVHVHIYKRCFDLANEKGYIKLQILACQSLGNAYFSKSQFVEAVFYHKEELELVRKTNDILLEVKALYNIGSAQYELQEYQDAINNCLSSLQLQSVNEINDKTFSMLSCLILTKAYWELNQFSVSYKYGVQCLKIADEIDDKNMGMKALLAVGDTLTMDGKYDEAISCYQNLLSLAKTNSDKEMEMGALIGLAGTYTFLKQYIDVERFAYNARQISEELSHTCYQKLALLALGNASYFSEEYDITILYLTQWLDINNGDTTNSDNTSELMQVYLKLIESSKNVDVYENVFYYLILSANVTGKDVSNSTKSRIEINWIDAFSFKFDDSNFVMDLSHKWKLWKYKHEIIKEQRKNKNDKIEQMATLRKLSFYYKLFKKNNKAIKCLTKILEIELGASQAPKNVSVHLSIAIIYVKQKNIEKAIEHCKHAMLYSKQCTSRFFSFECHFSLGKLLLQQGEIENGIFFLKEGTTDEDVLLDQFYYKDYCSHTWDDIKIMIHDSLMRCHSLLVKALIQTQKYQDALLQLDQNRGRVLRARLMDKYGIEHDSATENILLYEEIGSLALANKYNIIVYFVSEDNLYTFLVQDKKELQFIQQSINDCEQYFQSLLEKCYSEMALDKDVKCENRSLDSLLDKDTSQVQDDVYFKSVLLPEINRSGDEARGQSSKGNIGNNVSSCALGELYNTLFQGLQIDQDEIVIIPDGHLYKVPFAALRNPLTGRYLIESKRIRYISSMAYLKLLEGKSTGQPYNGALVIGNPQVGEVMFNAKKTDITGLPNAYCEALVAAHRLGAECLTGADATKAAVIDKLKQGVSVIHIAAHGFLEKSTIALAPTPEVRTKRTPIERDYMLTMADVQGCDIDAQLVVLSCCSSGRGEIMAEGVVGMCRAFLASGARAVVASLWAIDDDATQEFMNWFYINLIDYRHSCGESLQIAMIELMKSKNYNHPKFWAPFFLMGDDVKIQF